jgi:DNA-binding NarL/FixJ family response regulator
MDGLKVFRILIVDDSALFRQTLKEILHARFPSIDIDEATDGEKAKQKIKTSPPDLIFMDINLPGENGLVLTQKIKVRYPNIIITLLTGWDLPEYREASIQSKADYLLFKGSATQEKMFALVESVLPTRG